MFTVDAAYNRRNDRMIVPKGATVEPVMRTKHPQGIMMLGVVGSDGQKMPPYFFRCGLKVNTTVYMHVLKTVVKPWLKSAYPLGNYVFTQDGAPPHTSNLTQKYLAKYFAAYWEKTMWPASSPDLNPLDFSIWSKIQAEACATSHPNLESLKASIRSAWANMSSAYLVRTCKAFRPRVEAVIKAQGGHIEK